MHRSTQVRSSWGQVLKVPSPHGGFIAEGRGGSEATGEGRLSR